MTHGELDRLSERAGQHVALCGSGNSAGDIPQALTFPAGTTHPILQGAAGPLRGFPDHMHEGEVIVPWTRNDPLHWPYSQSAGDTRLEYPTVAEHQEAPVIIASGNTIGGHTTRTDGASCEQNNFKDEQEETHNPGFGVHTLCVYDGHKVSVGRVVTDSSFHHYMDLNLIGDPCAPSAPDTRLQGFTTAAGKPYMDDMTAFFVNTAAWLARVKKTCSFVSQLPARLLPIGCRASTYSLARFRLEKSMFRYRVIQLEYAGGAAEELTGLACHR